MSEEEERNARIAADVLRQAAGLRPNATIIATAAIPQRLDQLEDAVNGLAGVLQAHKEAIDALASLLEALLAKQVEIDTRLPYKPFTGPPTDLYQED